MEPLDLRGHHEPPAQEPQRFWSDERNAEHVPSGGEPNK